MDLFIGEKRTSVREKLKRNNILSVRIPANMTNLIQPLDLTVFDLTWFCKSTNETQVSIMVLSGTFNFQIKAIYCKAITC